MERLLGDSEWQELEYALHEAPSIGLRVNTLKMTSAEFMRLSPWPLTRIPWCAAGFVVPQHERPGLHPFHAAGLYYMQDPAAMAVAEAVAPTRGELVLDLAAAPGGKSTHLASLLGGEGVLVANDVHGGRARELSRNLERWGARNTIVTSAAVDRLAQGWPERFDAVLLDAPCSGEGMFRKAEVAAREWSSEGVSACSTRQDSLLSEAAILVRPGGRLAYSTCTFSPEENEEVIARFLEAEPDWELVDPGLEGVGRGRPEWAPGSRSQEQARAVRLWPHRHQGEGHFVAILRRRGEKVGPGGPGGGAGGGRIPEQSADLQHVQGRSRRVARRREADADGAGQRQATAQWREFVSEELVGDPLPLHALSLFRDGLYAIPAGAPPLAGVRTLRAGVWLGSVERSRFEPSHALALALKAHEARRRLELAPEDPRLVSYLAGGEIHSPGDDGWVLITTAGQPLGWGRRGRDIVKNRYPKGLRRPPGSEA